MFLSTNRDHARNEAASKQSRPLLCSPLLLLLLRLIEVLLLLLLLLLPPLLALA